MTAPHPPKASSGGSPFRRRALAAGLGAVAALAVALPMSGTANAAPAGPQGIDVYDGQGTINWKAAASDHQKFAFIKATEATSVIEKKFDEDFKGAGEAGIIRGAYHFARPNGPSGAAQADFFVKHGGAWSNDGKTLPGALDLESGAAEHEPTCWGLSPKKTVDFIHSFADEYKKKTGRDVAIYTGLGWWNQCTGGSADFADNPLWNADYGADHLPKGWKHDTFWQYSSSGHVKGVNGKCDVDVFKGSEADLQKLAGGGGGKPTDKPTDKPTGKPTDKPTGKPTDKPTGKPTDKPTGQPSESASSAPGQPSASSSGSGGGSGSLPVTGTSVGLIAGGGAIVLAGGITLFLLARRRRTGA